MRLLVCLLVLALLPRPLRAEEAAGIRFAPWTEATFAQARREKRILVVTVSTSWCHWCHVMKRETYGDARVRRVLERAFLPVDVDADARPDLAERFRRYRWPATAFLTGDGTPVLALRGYRAPEDFLAILARVEALVRAGGPYPGFEDPSAAGGERADTDREGLRALRDRLLRQLDRAWDPAAKGWGRGQKYPLAEPVAFGFRVRHKRGRAKVALSRSLETLAKTEQLIDPVFGGVFQYSLHGRWDRWHPEKIMSVNAGALANYAEAYRVTGEERWARAMARVRIWFERFLVTPEGTFRTSQDADAPGLTGERYYRLATEAERRPYGVPRVDRHVYARENGMAIQAYVAMYRTTSDGAVLQRASKAAAAILRSHVVEEGLLAHEAGAPAGPRFLLDQVEMGRALLALHQAGGDAKHLDAAVALAGGLERHFRAASGGFHDGTADAAAVGHLARRTTSLEGNANAARFLLALHAVTGEPRHREAALAAIRAVSGAETIAEHTRYVGPLLLAVEQAIEPYARIEVHGPAGSTQHQLLQATARSIAVRWPWIWVVLRPGEEVMATVCSSNACSDPVRDAWLLDDAVARVLGETARLADTR